MHSFIDQCGQTVTIPGIPKKIISLVPSQTELLHYLNLDKEVIGITKFCIHPSNWFRNKTRIGGTKNIKLEKIRQLKPDLVIANKEENDQQQIEILANEFPTWVSDIKDLATALEMIQQVGEICDRKNTAQVLVKNINQQFALLSPLPHQTKVAYLIWQDPFMVAGADTFIDSMLNSAGFVNAFSNQKRYPVVDLEQIKNTGCSHVFLSSEPYPFKEKHVADLQNQLPKCKVLLVDGELFSWYGSRLLKAPAYFNQLIKVIADNH